MEQQLSLKTGIVVAHGGKSAFGVAPPGLLAVGWTHAR